MAICNSMRICTCQARNQGGTFKAVPAIVFHQILLFPKKYLYTLFQTYTKTMIVPDYCKMYFAQTNLKNWLRTWYLLQIKSYKVKPIKICRRVNSTKSFAKRSRQIQQAK